MIRKSLLKAVAALAVLGLAAVPASAEEVPGVTDTTIKIGVPGPFTGDASSYSQAQIGLMAYYKWVNDNGGIHGRMIETIPEDTACSQSSGIAAVRKLIHQDAVFILHGISCSGVGLAIKPVVLEAEIPWVVAHAVNHHISSPPERYIFHSVPTSRTLGEAIGRFVISKPESQNYAIVAHSNEWAMGYKDPLLEYFKEHGVEPSLDLVMERGSTDATPHVLQIRQQQPDFIIAILYEAETAIFLRDADRYGLDIPTMGTLGTDLENTLARVGDMELMRNYYVQHPYIGPLDSTELQRFGDIILEYYPEETLSSFSFASIGGAVAVTEALRRAGRDLTRDSFIDAMESLKDFDTGILSAHVTYGPNVRDGVRDVAAAHYVDGRAVVFRTFGEAF